MYQQQKRCSDEAQFISQALIVFVRRFSLVHSALHFTSTRKKRNSDNSWLHRNFYCQGSKNYGLHRKISRKTVYFIEIHTIITQTSVIFLVSPCISRVSFFSCMPIRRSYKWKLIKNDMRREKFVMKVSILSEQFSYEENKTRLG